MKLKKYFIFLLIFLTSINGFTGSPMAFSSIAQSLSFLKGRLEVDDYAGNSNDLAFVNGHFYTGIRPVQSLFFLPASLLVNTLENIPSAAQIVSHANSLYIQNPKLPPAKDAGKFIFINLLTVAFFTSFSFFILIKYLPEKYTSLVFLFFISTASLNLISSFYSQSLTMLGLTFLGISLLTNLSSPHLILSCLFLGLGDYTSIPLALLVLLYLLPKFSSHKRSLLLLISILGLFALFELNFSYQVFGNPLSTPYQYRYSNSYVHKQGFMGIAPSNFIAGLSYRIFSSQEGALFFNPEVIVLSILSLYVLFTGKLSMPAKVLGLLTVTWIWLIAAGFVDKVSGLPGSRYLIPLLPFVFLVSLPFLKKYFLSTWFFVLVIIRTFWNWQVVATKGDVNLSVFNYIDSLFRYPPIFIFSKYNQAYLPYREIINVVGWIVICLFIYWLKINKSRLLRYSHHI